MVELIKRYKTIVSWTVTIISTMETTAYVILKGLGEASILTATQLQSIAVIMPS